jgi:hypothetical protein
MHPEIKKARKTRDGWCVQVLGGMTGETHPLDREDRTLSQGIRRMDANTAEVGQAMVRRGEVVQASSEGSRYYETSARMTLIGQAC